MKKREKIKMVTFYYDPAVVDLGALTDGSCPVAEETLLTEMENSVEKGGLIRVSHVQAELIRVARNCPGQPGSRPAYEWVGVTFVPVQQAVREPAVVEEKAYAY